MAKFRFPGKALKLNTRKRVRFRGSHAGSTPEELYTRRIRKGLDLFTQIFGESDEDEDGFEGFSSLHPEPRDVRKTGKKVFESPRQRGGKRSAQKVEDTCAALEGSGLVTRRRTSVVEMAVKNLRENVEKKKDIPECEERTGKQVGSVESVCDSRTIAATSQTSLTVGSDKCSEETKTSVVGAPSHVTRKQTNHRLSRPPTVKTALAKKLLAKAKKKAPSLPVVGEKSPKRFILPTMSVRSSRIIKPNKRLFADITEMCSTSSSLEAQGSTEAGEDSLSVSSKRLVKLTRKGRGSHTQFLSLPRSRTQSKNSLSGTEGVGRDRMRRTISLYTESITGPSKGQVGRPPKRLLRRLETPQQEVEAEVPHSPQRCDPKESRVKEKIEKLLRSPWDDRLKQTGKVGKAEDELMPAPATNTSPALSASVISRNILRKARLNLNKTTLQKIRNPASLQRLIPQCDEGNVEGKCATCDIAGGNSRKFGIVFCEVCSSFLRNASDGPREIFECQNSKGECQIQGLVEEDRCLACWLYRILLSCSMPNLLHDRLRKRLPTILKEQIPTSLARCMSIGGLPAISDKDAELASHTKRLPLDPGGGGAFGSVMDLPGGWRRKTGPEVIVISPSGEKFKSVQKLEEFLKKQGISTDARVLFGNNSPAVDRSTEVKSRPSAQTNSSGRGKVVMTTLPGGWTRRIKWRSAGDRFDTYVYSPDGRTFRSRRELSAYFQLIGKVDDIHKYFPVVTGHSDASMPSSSDTPGSSSTEPVSSSEPCSEVSSDDKSPEASECEAEQPKFRDRRSDCNNEKKSKFSHAKQMKPKIPNEQGRPRSKSVSKLKPTDNSEKPAGQLNVTDVTDEVKNFERKHKKPKIMRSRSLSVGRKKKSDDASLTDTTESESEQRKSGASTIFSKAFSRSRSKIKSKAMDSQSSVVENKLTTLVDAPVHRFQELSDSKMDTSIELEDEAKRFNTPDESFKELYDIKAGVMAVGDKTKKSPSKKHKKTAEETPVFTEPNVISEMQLDQKIVLKIPKKAIKPVGKKHRNRNKQVENDCAVVVGDDKGVTEHLIVQDNVEVEKKHKVKHAERTSTTVVRDDKEPLEQPLLKDAKEVLKDTDQGVVAQISSTNKSFDGTQGKLSNLIQEDPVDMESDVLTGYMSVDSKVSSPNASEGEVVPDAISVPEIQTKPKTKRLSRYQTCHFGNGWSRKIRWSEKGEGRVTLLHSPDSQTFRSRIELLAYFKKAGRSKVDLDFYFPPHLRREHTSLSTRINEVGKLPCTESSSVTAVTSTSAQSSEISEFSDSETVAKTSEDSSISGEESKRPNVPKVIKCFRKVGGQSALKSIPENVSEESTFQNQVIKISGSVPVLSDEVRKPISQLNKNGRKVIIVSTQDGKSSVKTETEEAEGTVNESGGPRVKHVCRSQAQVLGISRAVFPSPRKEEDRLTGIISVPSTKGNQKRKIVTVTTTASGKVLRKTQWCSKCPGCTTPNCLKCVNCLDMKKYGGPGTKKKPCVMRKCHNPRLSVKSAISQESSTKQPHQVITTTVSSPSTIKEARKVPVISVKVQEDKIELPQVANDNVSKSMQQEKGVFIPRHVTRTQPDQKDRGDIAAGKQFVPGTFVNIDYWQGYDADEMMLTGYPVTTASSLHPQVLCFRCGSVGKEQVIRGNWYEMFVNMWDNDFTKWGLLIGKRADLERDLLYCAWCCEGIHPYCLEDGEGPESEVEEVFWICRRCAVCHVCGAPGADSLLRCSDCRNYYHLECLGPSAHNTCQPTPDRPWEAESWALLGESWPRQSAIYDVSEFNRESMMEDVVMHTELDALKDADEDVDEDDLVPDIFFLPVNGSEDVHKKITQFDSYDTGLEADDTLDFEALEDAICLEDSIIEVFRDRDLYTPDPSLTTNPQGEEVVSMKEDEYLYLGYKKEYEYPCRKIEISYFRLLQTIHNEFFDTLGYPSWRELLNQGLVKERSSGTGSGSDTETASEGESDSDESEFDWDDVLEIRRYEAMQEMKEREEKRREEERKQRELDREKARLERLKELEKEAKEKELAQMQLNDNGFVPKMKVVGSDEAVTKEDFVKKKPVFKKKKKRGRPPGSVNKPKYGDEDFVVIDDIGQCENSDKDGSADTPRKKKFRQPKSWEEFDRLFAILTSSYSNRESDEKINGQVKTKKRKILFSDNGIIGVKHGKLEHKKQKIKSVSDNANNVKVSKKGKKAKVLPVIKDKKAKRVSVIKDKYIPLKDKKKVKSSKAEVKRNLKISVVKEKKSQVSKKTISSEFDGKLTSKKRASVLTSTLPASRKEKNTVRKSKLAKFCHSKESTAGKTKTIPKDEVDGLRNEIKLSHEQQINDADLITCIISDQPIAEDDGISVVWENYGLSGISQDGTNVTCEQSPEQVLRVTDNFIDSFLVTNTKSTCIVYAKDHSDLNARPSEESCIDEKKSIERPMQFSSSACTTSSFDVQTEAHLLKETEVKCRPEEENSDKENLPNAKSLEKIIENGILGSSRKVIITSEEAETSTVSEGSAIFESSVGTTDNCGSKRQLEISKDKTTELPEKRLRRSHGRASELASQRKAMLDY